MLSRICISFLLLVLGALIYLVFRQDVLFLQWMDAEVLEYIKVPVTHNEGNPFSYLLLFSLADALWYAALLTIQLALCDGGAVGRWLFGLSIAFPFLFESMQWLGAIPGTFDWLDIVTYLLTLITFLLCQRKHFSRFWC